MVLNSHFDRSKWHPFHFSPGLSCPCTKTVVHSRLGFILTSNTDVSALVHDFIKAQPAVYCSRRLPRLIFLQYIPFCWFLAPASSQVGIYHSSAVESQVYLLNSDGTADYTKCLIFASRTKQGPVSSSEHQLTPSCPSLVVEVAPAAQFGMGAEDKGALGSEEQWEHSFLVRTDVDSNPVSSGE